jgi:hypothetical protein
MRAGMPITFLKRGRMIEAESLGQDHWGRIIGAGSLGQDHWGRIIGAGSLGQDD